MYIRVVHSIDEEQANHYNCFSHYSVYWEPTKCQVLCKDYKDEFDIIFRESSFNNYVNGDIMVTTNEKIIKLLQKHRGGVNLLLTFLTLFAFNEDLLTTQIISEVIYALK